MNIKTWLCLWSVFSTQYHYHLCIRLERRAETRLGVMILPGWSPPEVVNLVALLAVTYGTCGRGVRVSLGLIGFRVRFFCWPFKITRTNSLRFPGAVFFSSACRWWCDKFLYEMEGGNKKERTKRYSKPCDFERIDTAMHTEDYVDRFSRFFYNFCVDTVIFMHLIPLVQVGKINKSNKRQTVPSLESALHQRNICCITNSLGRKRRRSYVLA